VSLLATRDVSLMVRERLCGSCVRSSVLHGGETWQVRAESEVALRWAGMEVVRWIRPEHGPEFSEIPEIL